MFEIFKKRTKEEKILHLLQSNKNNFVSAWKIVMYAKTLNHTKLIQRLKRYHTIENKCEWVKWEKFSFYKIVVND